MEYRLARRMSGTPKSFIMELISICQDPDVISFASGLPSPDLLAKDGVAAATMDLLSEEEGRSSLQYNITEGYLPLREYIAERYRRRLGLDVDPDQMIILNGSQQSFDLMGKALIDPGAPMVIERPGYIGAVQSFCVFEPEFHSVRLNEDGPDVLELERVIKDHDPRLFYSVPNSQNPTGATYSLESREAVAEAMDGSDTVLLEDDAYGELGFETPQLPPLASFMPERTVLTGSFSKVFSPGMRCGWMVGPPEVMEAVTVAKEAADLHSNSLSQRVIHRWLMDNDLDAHIARINQEYRMRRDLMMGLMDELMPNVKHTRPSGGLFVWMEIPRGSIMELFKRALDRQVAIMPGPPFHTDGGGQRGARLNFSNSSPEMIEEGMIRLAEVTNAYLRDLG